MRKYVLQAIAANSPSESQSTTLVPSPTLYFGKAGIPRTNDEKLLLQFLLREREKERGT